MDINFKELKRKDLQRLCKKHALRANATNSQMVDSLIYLFKICEKNKEGNVSSKGYGGIGSSKVERVEGEAEKVVIVIDDDDDELGSVLRSADRKSSPKRRRSSEKDEQIEARLDGSSDCGGSKGTRVKWHVENSIILLDEKNDEPCPVLRSAYRKKSRRSSRKVGKVCEPNRSNEENQPVGVLRNPKEGLLVPVRSTRSRSMNSDVAHSPVIEKIKTRKDRQVARQNAELPLDTSEFEGIEVGTRKENPSVMMAAAEVKVKRRRKSMNSSMKVNDEIMVSFPIKVLVTENLVGDVVNEKHVNTRMGSAITFSIDGEQAKQGTPTRNEKDIEESELCTAGNLMEVVVGGVQTKRGKKRTRAGLEEDSPVLEKEIDKLGSAHHPELLHTSENVKPEVCFASSQILGSPLSSNLASSRPCLLLSELQGCQDVYAAAITPTRKIETESSDRHNKLELQELFIFRNSVVTRNTSAEEKNDSCHSQLCSSYTTEIVEVEQQLNASLSSEKEIIDPQNLIVSHITDVSTIVSGHFVCSEFDGKDAESTKRRDHRENFSVSPDDIKMLSACKAHLDAVEMGDVIFLETNQSHGEPIEDEDGTAKENGSNISPSGSDEKTNVANFKVTVGYHENITAKFESFQKFPDSQRLAETNSKHFFAPFESVYLQEELYQIKGREPFKSEGNVHIIQGKLKHDEEKLCGSEEPQAVGYDEHSEAKIFAGSPPAKVEETAPFGLHERVDNLFEKLLCLKKVLRGEIDPVITDSSLPFEEEISCKVLHATSEKEMTSGESFSSHDQESQILNALLPTDPVLEDCEQDSSNSEVNAPNKIDEVAIISSADALQENPELWKCMKSCEGNNTDAASPYECYLYIRPTGGELCQDGGVVDKKFLEIVQGVTARPGEVLEDIKFVSPGKLSSFDLEGERSSSPSCISNSKLNNSIINSPAKYINQFGTKGLSKTLDAHGSLTRKQAYAKHTVDILKMESHDEVPITTSSESLKGNLGLWKCMESCEANNTDATSYESPAEVEPCQVGDINVMDFLETTQGATSKPREILEKIKLASPRKESLINLEIERNSSASFGSQKYNLNKSITNSPVEDIKHFEDYCFSENLGGQSSLPIKEAHVKHTVDVLKMESHEKIAITSSGDALHGMIELLKCIESSAEKNLDAAFPYECDFSYNWHSVREPQPGDDIDVREFLKNDPGAATKPGEVLEKIKFLSPSKQSSNDLEVERNCSTSCISKKGKLNKNITNSPAKDIKHFGAQCLSNTSDGHSGLPIKQAYAKHSVDIEVESHDGSIPGTDTLVDSVPSEVKASFGSNAIDPVEEITRKLINFCDSSSRKAIKSNILNAPTTNSAGISSVGLIKDKENTRSTKMKYSSKPKIRKSASAGSIRRPLQSVTNQMIE